MSRRTSERSTDRDLQVEVDNYEATEPLVNHRSQLTLDDYVESGLDTPLSTHVQHPKPSCRSSNRTSHAGTGSSHDNLIKREPRSTPEGHDEVLGASLFDRTPSANRQRKSLRKGWRAGVVASAIMTATILLINLTLTIWASLYFKVNDSIGDAYIGDCVVVDRLSTVLHLSINGLSSAMLSASNYTMQCLTAPTRKECDITHARGEWLDIGVSSIQNLARIRWSRGITWALLALSSIPIHVLYNSAIFKELDNNVKSYNKVMVSSQFLDTETIDFTVFPKNLTYSSDPASYYSSDLAWYNTSIASQLHAAYYSDRPAFDRLNPKDCFDMYNTTILSGHSHLLLVMSDAAVKNISSRPRVSQYPYPPPNEMWPNWSDYSFPEVDAKVTSYFW
jgi:hypothetical protein